MPRDLLNLAFHSDSGRTILRLPFEISTKTPLQICSWILGVIEASNHSFFGFRSLPSKIDRKSAITLSLPLTKLNVKREFTNSSNQRHYRLEAVLMVWRCMRACDQSR